MIISKWKLTVWRKNWKKTDWQIVNSWLGTLYPELRDTSNYKTMISYVDPDKLTGFYERRQQVLDEFLEISGQVGAEKRVFASDGAKGRKNHFIMNG